jgi:hypothetical protein
MITSVTYSFSSKDLLIVKRKYISLRMITKEPKY